MGVFESLGLCINVHDTDVDYAVSPASPKASDQDVATVFLVIVLNQAFDCWALLLFRGQYIDSSKKQLKCESRVRYSPYCLAASKLWGLGLPIQPT
jgi:hypothetical protein